MPGRLILFALLLAGFNPRPALRPGDAALTPHPPAFHAFQSAPGLEAGRCVLPWLARGSDSEFQSAPGLEAGRCAPYWVYRHSGSGFNPRPALRPGDA